MQRALWLRPACLLLWLFAVCAVGTAPIEIKVSGTLSFALSLFRTQRRCAAFRRASLPLAGALSPCRLRLCIGVVRQNSSLSSSFFLSPSLSFCFVFFPCLQTYL